MVNLAQLATIFGLHSDSFDGIIAISIKAWYFDYELNVWYCLSINPSVDHFVIKTTRNWLSSYNKNNKFIFYDNAWFEIVNRLSPTFFLIIGGD